MELNVGKLSAGKSSAAAKPNPISPPGAGVAGVGALPQVSGNPNMPQVPNNIIGTG